MTTFQGITFAAIPDRNAPAPRSAYADGDERPAWTRPPVSVGTRIKGTWMRDPLVQEFVFPNSDEADAFKAWCGRNPELCSWVSSGPAVIRSAASAIGYVERLARLGA